MSSLQKLRKLNDICLFVDDFKGSLNFYVEKFGFKVVRLQPDPEHANYAEFEFNGTSVTLWQKDGVIEAMHHASLPVWSVQWHPERMCLARARADTVDGGKVLAWFVRRCAE